MEPVLTRVRPSDHSSQSGARTGRTLRSARPVVCQAAKEQKDAAAAIKSAVISGAAALAASPAFALVSWTMDAPYAVERHFQSKSMAFH